MLVFLRLNISQYWVIKWKKEKKCGVTWIRHVEIFKGWKFIARVFLLLLYLAIKEAPFEAFPGNKIRFEPINIVSLSDKLLAFPGMYRVRTTRCSWQMPPLQPFVCIRDYRGCPWRENSCHIFSLRIRATISSTLSSSCTSAQWSSSCCLSSFLQYYIPPVIPSRCSMWVSSFGHFLFVVFLLWQKKDSDDNKYSFADSWTEFVVGSKVADLNCWIPDKEYPSISCIHRSFPHAIHHCPRSFVSNNNCI